MDLDLERLYDDQAQGLFAFALNLTRSEDETREVLQELFLRLARDPDWHRDVRNQRAFLLRLVHNLVIDRYRRRAAREQRHEAFREESLDLFAPAQDPDAAAFQAALDAALGQLPVDQRAVVILGFNLSAARPVEGQSTGPVVSWSLWAAQRQSIAELIALGDGVEPPVRPAPRVPSPRSESPMGRMGVG